MESHQANAEAIRRTYVFDCAGARDAEAELQLRRLLTPEAAAKVCFLSVERHARGEQCLVHVEGSCLQ